jgi:hypothetical protein
MVGTAAGVYWPVPTYLMAMSAMTLFSLITAKRFAVEENKDETVVRR